MFMDVDLGVRIFIIVKGYIDARDERGNAIYGTMLSVVARREVKYLSVMFSRDETSKSMEWNDLLFLHRDRGADRDPVAAHHEEELFKYLERSPVLCTVAKNRNTKQAEQAISRYCLDGLQLKAVSLIEYFDASESDVAFFEREGGPASGSSTGGEQKKPSEPSPEAASDGDAEGKPEEAKNKEDVVVRCEPILDPVNGVAMNELNIGEMVMTRLPGDSVFFKLLSRNIPSFDGVVTAAITGILMNELGTATISMALSDGITGVMRLSGKVKVKVAPQSDDGNEPRRKKASELPEGLVFGAAGAIVLIAAALALHYILR
jgi:hypothetical protein